MKRLLLAIALGLGLIIPAKAQIIINDNLFQGRLSEIKATVLDSLTNEPVGYASVYVIPSKDTTITNFTLSDAKGEAKLDEVPYGSYVFHVEMMGYKPFIKEKYFRERRVDMGTIKLRLDEQFLQAAVVSDVGNPIVIKQDTVEFNASSFKVGSNAMLKDLLKRMPGMEITEDGKVKFNGEAIDKLTVGGRTFFFNDQSTALNNLPAAVVDKIRVIDRESEQTRASGLQDGSREKVLDVALKKEYEKGWFGNVALKGGTTAGEKEGDDVLRDNRGLLWSGNALVSAYTEKDQVTLIANGQNINDSNGVIFVVTDDDGEVFNSGQGLSTAAQFGVNANTSRIKDVETTIGANYKYTDTDSGSRSERTTYLEDGSLQSSAENTGKQYSTGVGANMEFKKEKGKVWFHFNPSFRYNRADSRKSGNTDTYRGGSFLNKSETAANSLSTSKSGSFSGDITFRELWGKENRSLLLALSGDYNVSGGIRDEISTLTTAEGPESRALRYDSNGSTRALSGNIRYTEPLGDKWMLSAMGQISWSARDNVSDAFDAAGRNDYYSSVSDTKYLSQQYDLTGQYKFSDKSWLTLGAKLIGALNETYSKSYGIEGTTGKDDWIWYVTPTMRMRLTNGDDRYNLSMSGYSRRPSASRLLPVLNISDPSRLSLGNVYLKPYGETYFSGSWTRNDREKFSSLILYFYGQVTSSPIQSAQWYDADGIMYSIPVNSMKPGFSGQLSVNYTTPLDSKKLWTLDLSGAAAYSSSVSYQARAALPGLDKETFDYSAFMEQFWGDASGDRFYIGKSGFSESITHTAHPYASFRVKYNQNHYSFSAGAGTSLNIARYSLDPSVNMNTMSTRLSAHGSYTTKHEFEFGSGIDYVFYSGYAEGYGQPEWQWDAEISKNIGAFNLSVKIHDILNQTRNLTHTMTANYEEDSYRLIMGRYILFGVKWNFGKMNAAHSQRAQNAAWNMVF